jgi:hypothetical protein
MTGAQVAALRTGPNSQTIQSQNLFELLATPQHSGGSSTVADTHEMVGRHRWPAHPKLLWSRDDNSSVIAFLRTFHVEWHREPFHQES